MDLEAKRVYGDRTGATTALVASAAGLARVAVSDDAVGEFGLVHRDDARDVAAGGGRVAVATAADVLLADGTGLSGTGFGPADAVGVHGDTLLAAGEGRVARFVDGTWTTTAEVADVRAIDGGLLAAADGVFRPDGSHVGLRDVRDVAADGPIAATGDGLYYLANGWMRALDGAFRAVATAGDRAHAATADAVYARGDAPGEWREAGTPAFDLAALAEAPEATYAATAEGTFCVAAGGGWRTQALGLPDVRAVAVPDAPGFED